MTCSRKLDQNGTGGIHEGIDVRKVDLKDPGRTDGELDALLEETDLLEITATRPASLERLGLSWEHLHARFPRLSQVAIVGNPAPEEDLPGHDLLYQAEQGLVQPPHMPPHAWPTSAARRRQ